MYKSDLQSNGIAALAELAKGMLVSDSAPCFQEDVWPKQRYIDFVVNCNYDPSHARRTAGLSLAAQNDADITIEMARKRFKSLPNNPYVTVLEI
ncbi:MAG: hypothetical protein JW754_03805 [Candidatus Aenigmarchaeota archaeon]|nr:hypothetical protein [Candidatus Aenigmarchaeota archaeon]